MMGTRSLTRIIPRQEGLSYSDGHMRGELALANIYQQYDGYPEYMAVEYAEWMKDIKNYAGGAGCFAAEFIAKFRNRSFQGQISLQAVNNEIGWAEYIYTLYPKANHDTYMSIYRVSTRTVIFVGRPDQALEKYKINTK